MFTGIVEGRARVLEVARRGEFTRLVADLEGRAVELGESVALAGVCLTAAQAGARPAFDVQPATLGRTTLGRLRPGDEVNFERALRVGSSLGGHFVTGHVDGVGRVLARRERPPGAELELAVPAEARELLVPRGSLAVDGVSLTIAALGPEGASVALVPHTLAVTTLGRLGPGDEVNIEADLLGKYVRRLLGGPAAAGGLDEEFLRRHGFA